MLLTIWRIKDKFFKPSRSIFNSPAASTSFIGHWLITWPSEKITGTLFVSVSLLRRRPAACVDVWRGSPSIFNVISINVLYFLSASKSVLKRLLENASSSDAFGDRKSTRLNSSHVSISYAVFCLKKKKKSGDGARA